MTRSPCHRTNCLKTIPTGPRSLSLFPLSYQGQAGPFSNLPPTTSDLLDSPGRATATFQDVSSDIINRFGSHSWCRQWRQVLCTSGPTGDPHRPCTSPCEGTSTASGYFKVCKTNQAGRQSSSLCSLLLLGIIIHCEILTFLTGRNIII